MNSLPTLEANINNVEMIFDEKRLSHQLNNLIQFVKQNFPTKTHIKSIYSPLQQACFEVKYSSVAL